VTTRRRFGSVLAGLAATALLLPAAAPAQAAPSAPPALPPGAWTGEPLPPQPFVLTQA
jgi:hypothetical protein